jgi:hypothetical protein
VLAEDNVSVIMFDVLNVAVPGRISPTSRCHPTACWLSLSSYAVSNFCFSEELAGIAVQVESLMPISLGEFLTRISNNSAKVFMAGRPPFYHLHELLQMVKAPVNVLID